MKILLDTNLLVYAYDPAEPARQMQAVGVLDRLHLLGTGRLSSQALAEFMNGIIRPLQGMRFINPFAAHFRLEDWV